jgi:predicted CoA-binding protein
VLRASRRVAVLGAKPDPREPAHYVPAYLQSRGYHVLPVNPVFEGQTILGERCVGTLAELDAAVDVIDVFRRPSFLPGHAREILALPWKPRAVWFQLGIRHDGAAQALAQAGIDVIQDRCMMPEHRRLVWQTA